LRIFWQEWIVDKILFFLFILCNVRKSFFVGAMLAVARFGKTFSIWKHIPSSGQPQGLPLQMNFLRMKCNNYHILLCHVVV